jgi:hypothetical protein
VVNFFNRVVPKPPLGDLEFLLRKEKGGGDVVKSNRIFIIAILCVITLSNSGAGKSVNFNDGQSHLINDSTYQSYYVYLDLSTYNNPGTHLELVNGGIIGWTLSAYNISTVDFSGGSIGNDFVAYDNSTVTMSGGSVTDCLSAIGDSTITMSGGSVGNELSTYVNGIIYLVGSGFEVTDLSGTTTILSVGDKLSDFGTLVDDGSWDYYAGSITGILSDGSSLNNTFRLNITGEWVGTGDIILIPEPATLSLFGFGTLMLSRKR